MNRNTETKSPNTIYIETFVNNGVFNSIDGNGSKGMVIGGGLCQNSNDTVMAQANLGASAHSNDQEIVGGNTEGFATNSTAVWGTLKEIGRWTVTVSRALFTYVSGWFNKKTSEKLLKAGVEYMIISNTSYGLASKLKEFLYHIPNIWN